MGESVVFKIILLNVLVFISIKGFAFTLVSENAPRFPLEAVKIDIAQTSCSDAGFGVEGLRSLVERASQRYWNSVSTSSLKLEIGSLTDDNFEGVDNASDIYSAVRTNRILATCNDELFAPGGDFEGAAGVGGIGCDASGSCIGVLVVNAHADSPVRGLSDLERLTIVGHEIGHALGLGHTEVEEALMYYSIGLKSQEYLHFTDMMGISYLYPQDSKAAGLLGACGTIALVGQRGDGPPSGGLGAVALSFMIIFLLGFFGPTFFLKKPFYGRLVFA